MDKEVGKAVAAIRRAKVSPVKKAKAKGIYENFGDREQRAIWDAHWEVLQNYNSDTLLARTAFQQFRDWCSTYNG